MQTRGTLSAMVVITFFASAPTLFTAASATRTAAAAFSAGQFPGGARRAGTGTGPVSLSPAPWVVGRPRAASFAIGPPRGRSAAAAPRMSTDDEGEEGGGGRRKRRRRRKDGGPPPAPSSEGERAPEPAAAERRVEEEVPDSPPSRAPSPIEKDEVVQMEVRDVRDILSGKPASAPVTASEDDDEDEDEYEWVYEDEDDDESSGSEEGSGLEKLLADAKKMRAEASSDSEGLPEGAAGEESVSIPDTVRNVISTIVTIDFFVVCALLLWFLAGIFCSYVLRDDTVQIAFNNIFEPVVQPALGVLMIASAAGAVFKKDEEE